MKKFKKFEIKKTATIKGGSFGDPNEFNLTWEDTVWAGNGGVGTDAYNSQFKLIFYY